MPRPLSYPQIRDLARQKSIYRQRVGAVCVLMASMFYAGKEVSSLDTKVIIHEPTQRISDTQKSSKVDLLLLKMRELLPESIMTKEFEKFKTKVTEHIYKLKYSRFHHGNISIDVNSGLDMRIMLSKVKKLIEHYQGKQNNSSRELHVLSSLNDSEIKTEEELVAYEKFALDLEKLIRSNPDRDVIDFHVELDALLGASESQSLKGFVENELGAERELIEQLPPKEFANLCQKIKCVRGDYNLFEQLNSVYDDNFDIDKKNDKRLFTAFALAAFESTGDDKYIREACDLVRLNKMLRKYPERQAKVDSLVKALESVLLVFETIDIKTHSAEPAPSVLEAIPAREAFRRYAALKLLNAFCYREDILRSMIESPARRRIFFYHADCYAQEMNGDKGVERLGSYWASFDKMSPSIVAPSPLYERRDWSTTVDHEFVHDRDFQDIVDNSAIISGYGFSCFKDESNRALEIEWKLFKERMDTGSYDFRDGGLIDSMNYAATNRHEYNATMMAIFISRPKVIEKYFPGVYEIFKRELNEH